MWLIPYAHNSNNLVETPLVLYIRIYKYIYILFCSIFSCYQVPEMVLLDLFFTIFMC